MNSRTRRGQILLIAAFALVVLLGVAALVIDLGFAWMERRAQQNAVDPASVAAARYLDPSDPAGQATAACFYVKQHGFFTTDDSACSSARGAGQLYVGPPTSGPFLGSAYVEVRINRQHSTFFGGVIGQGTLSISTGAVAANGGSNINSHALVALDPTSCGAGMLTGNGVINITSTSGTGGSVYVNSICGIDPVYGTDNDGCENHNSTSANPRGAMVIQGSNAILKTPHLFVRGTCDKTANPFPGYCSSPPCATTEGADEISDSLFGMIEPSHAGLPSWGRAADGCPLPGKLLTPAPGCVFEGSSGYPLRLNPGVYYGGLVIRGQAQIELNPGIYYIAGGGIQMSGGNTRLDAVDGAGGIGRVLIFSTGDPTFAGSCVQDANWPPAPPVPSTQYATPTGDKLSDGAWTGTFEAINEFTADDTDFLASPPAPATANFYEVSLSGVDTPASLSGVVVRYRYFKSADAGQTIDLTVELREGSNVIASQTHTNIPGGGAGWQNGSFTLSTAEAAAITDWYNLSVRFRPLATDTAEDRQAQISWLRVDVPPGAGGAPARRCQGKVEIVGGTSFKAMPTDIDPWAGMLLWQDGTLSGNGKGNNPIAKVDVGGNGSINLAGTIYGPRAECFLRGNGSGNPADKTAAVQVICWQFEIVGNGGLNIPYDANNFVETPQKGLVH